MDRKEILDENEKLKKENRELKRIIEIQEAKQENMRLQNENNELKNIIDEETCKKSYESSPDEEAQIISLLKRSSKRVKVLEALEYDNKIPTQISRDINDSSYNISKYLKVLKEHGLVICLNENDKRYRFYSITEKGEYYLNILRRY